MRRRELEKQLRALLNSIASEFACSSRPHGHISGGFAREGYAGGYAAAVSDILLVMRDTQPSDHWGFLATTRGEKIMTEPTPEEIARAKRVASAFTLASRLLTNLERDIAEALHIHGAKVRQEALREAAEAMKPYIRHSGWCAQNDWPLSGPFKPCSCGLDKVRVSLMTEPGPDVLGAVDKAYKLGRDAARQEALREAAERARKVGKAWRDDADTAAEKQDFRRANNASYVASGAEEAAAEIALMAEPGPKETT